LRIRSGARGLGPACAVDASSRFGAASLGAWAVAVVLLSAGCRQDMHDQPKYEPLEAGAFFRDGQASRPLVEGTVARGQLRDDEHLYTGKVNGQPATTFPFPITREFMDRGRQRYEIYCAACHDRAGTGRGMIVRRGYRQPQSFHIDRLREAPPGHFYDVITNGFGAMPDYRAQILPEDRWAVVAYIRALQLSQHAPDAAGPGQDKR
jgi:Cytochrome C oxidase, cbb3-type, subunit III